MFCKIKPYLESLLVFTTGFDQYYARFNSFTIRRYQSRVDFSAFGSNYNLRRQLLWALVHSLDVEDVQYVLIMLQGSLLITNNLWEKKRLMHLLAIVYYKSGHYSKSLDLVNRCLDIKPQCGKLASLKFILKARIKDGRIKTMLSIASMVVGVGMGVVGPTTLWSCTWVIEAIISSKDRLKKVVDATSANCRNPLQLKEEIYLLAERYYKKGNYSRARLAIDCCLQIDPQCGRASILKKSIESEWSPVVYG